MVLLQRTDVQTLAPDRAYAVDRGGSAGDRGDAGYMMVDGRAPDRLLVKEGFAAEWCVDDETDLAALDVVDDVGSPFIDFINGLDIDAGTAQHLRRSARRNDLETDFDEICHDL